MKQVPEIMATIGPTLEKPEDLRCAVEAGARWFRLPCGYRQRPHLENARDIRAVAATADVPAYMPVDVHDLHVALTEIDHRLVKLYPERLRSDIFPQTHFGAQWHRQSNGEN